MLIERQKNNNCNVSVEEILTDGTKLKHNIEFSAYKGNPRFTLWRDYKKDDTLTEEEKKELLYKNTTNVTFTCKSFQAFTNFIQQLPKNQNPIWSYGHVSKNIKFKDGEKTDEIYEQGEMTVGRDEEGLYYFEIGEKDKTTVRYRFIKEDFFDSKINGKLLTAPKAKSLIYYKSYFTIAQDLSKTFLTAHILTEAMKKMHLDKK